MINITEIVRPAILNLQPYSSARNEFTGCDGIFMDANENPYGSFNRYPDPYQYKLKKSLAARKSVSLSQIFVGNGSDEVIDLAFRIFCRPGKDKAISLTPTYGMYEVSAAINDVEMIKIPLNAAFQIDRKKVEPYFSDSSVKLFFICSPNNPTANLMRTSDIIFILEHFKGIVILDEAYIDFASADSLIGMIEKYNNLIVSQTFSKAWGAAAIRIGTAYADAEIMALYNRVKPPYNISELSQRAAIKILADENSFDRQLKLILQEKEKMIRELQKIRIVKKIYPSDANFLLVKVANADLVYAYLVDQKIIVRNRSQQVSQCLRITIGSSHENDELIKALRRL